MRLTRKQIESIHSAMQDTVADEIEVQVDNAGKVRVSAVEHVERLRPIPLHKVQAKSNNARRVTA